jgi:uncharacterized protein
MSQASQLHQLQMIDTEIDKMSLRINEIDSILANNTEVLAAEQKKLEMETHCQKILQDLRLIESEADAARIKLEVNNSALYGGKIQNPKELKDLQNEVAANKKRLTTLEDSQLTSMIAMEEAEKDLQVAQHVLDDVMGNKKELIIKLQEEKKHFSKEIENLVGHKSLFVNSILPVNLEIYAKLRSHKRGLAVANIEDDSCSACGSSLTPAERQLSRSPTQLVFCSSCGRILYAG